MTGEPKPGTNYLTRGERNAARVGVVFVVVVSLLVIGFWVGVAYVVVHFVFKYW